MKAKGEEDNRASFVEHRLQASGLQSLQHVGSAVVVHGLSRSVGCGIVLDQGLNLCPLHWQVVHSEAKETETLVFGAEKVCCRDMQGEGWLML